MSIIKSEAAINVSRLKNGYYPGRGIITGLTPSGEALMQVYWTMGRSPNSRNRVLVKEGGDVFTRIRDDKQGMQNEELNLYRASAQVDGHHIVTNGRQTDTIAESLQGGGSFEDALYQWEFETDGPIYTPRISGVATVHPETRKYEYKLAIIKAAGRCPQLLSHQFFSYRGALPGIGHCVHTYSLTETCYPFPGEPFLVTIGESLEETANFYWNLLSDTMRVGLYAKRVNVKTGEFDDIVLSI